MARIPPLALCLALLAAPAAAATCERGQEVVMPDGMTATVVQSRGGICVVRDARGEEITTTPADLVPVPRNDPYARKFFADFSCGRYGLGEALYTLSLRPDGTWARSDRPEETGTWRAEDFDTLTLFGASLPLVRVVQLSDGVTFATPDGDYVMECLRG